MKVQLFAMPTVPATLQEREELRPIGRNSERYQMMLDEVRRICVVADELGYNQFSTTEHHLHSEGGEALPNPLMLYTDLAARTERIQFCPNSLVPVADDPIRIAEDIALFDQITRGRVAVSFARGYQKRWLQILSQGGNTSLIDEESDRKNREVYDEYLEVIKKAWTQDVWDHDGTHYQVPFPYQQGVTGWGGAEWTRQFGSPGEVDDTGTVRKVGVTPPPFQKPHPQIFVPFTLSPKTLVNAAKNGYVAMMYEGRAAEFLMYARQYQQLSQEAGREAGLGQGVGAVRSICLGDTYDEAFEIAVQTAAYEYHNYFNKFGMGEVFRTPEDPADRMVMFKDEADGAKRMIEAGQLLCGTPDDVKRQMEQLHNCHAPNRGEGSLEWLSWTFFCQGTQPADVQSKQLELFASKVWPAFKD